MHETPTAGLEIVQRCWGTGRRTVGPLEDLDRSDLDILLQQKGLGIQVINNYENFFRTFDAVMTDSRTVELWEIRNPLLLATVLKGMVRKKPQFEQLLSWLYPEAIEKCETHIREVAIENKSEEMKGPKTLDGEDLLVAMQNSPSITPSKSEELTTAIDELFLEETVRPHDKGNNKAEVVIELTKEVGRGLDYARLEALEEALFNEVVDSAIDNALVDNRAESYAIVKAMMERIHGRSWSHVP